MLAACCDLLLLAVATVVAILGRQHLGVFEPRSDVVEYVSQAAAPLLAGWLVAVLAFGGYSSEIFGAGTEEYRHLASASLLWAGVVGIGCYLVSFQLSRGFYVLVFAIGLPLLILGRVALRRSIHRARTRGHLRERVVIVGDSAHVDELAAVLRREPWMGYTVYGALTSPADRSETAAGIPVLADTHRAAEVVAETGVEVIAFVEGAFASSAELRRAMWELEGLPVRSIVVPSLTDVSRERLKVRPIAGLPLVHLESPRALQASRWAKRVFDVVGALGLLVVTLPLTAATAIAVKLHDGGPVFFRQTRIGRDGRPFDCWKFRSMVVDAEQMKASLESDRAGDSVLFKIAHDPRITRPGRWIRRFSLDEFPQLWNVVRGQMSLVGPRPPLPDEVARYETDVTRRLRVRPGMTGLWQVSGRSDLSWEDTVRLDLYYVDNWSMLQDLVILLRTLNAVLGSRGAY